MTAGYTLITGASSGIGLALAECFATKRHKLILVARREARLLKLAEGLRTEHGVDVQVFAHDLLADSGPEELFQRIVASGLLVDTLVNNAGRGEAIAFSAQSMDSIKNTMSLNMTALTVLSRLFLDAMLAQGEGRILNIASVAGFMPGPGLAVYHATKAYVLSFSEALNVECQGRGVSVTASCPGPTESEFHQHAKTRELKNFDRFGLMPAERVAKQAYEATMAGESVVVHGQLNQLLTLSPKLLPRKWVPRIVAKIMSRED